MIETLNFNYRIAELIEQDYSDSDIARIIYEEYGIRVSQIIIKRKRSDSFLDNINRQKNQDFRQECSFILECLKQRNGSMTSREISRWITEEKGSYYSKQEINKIIHSKLKDEVGQNRNDFTYYLQPNLFSGEVEVEVRKPDGFLDKLLGKSPSVILEEFQEIFQEKHIEVNSGNKLIDELIKSVVKDNYITECEEDFLKQKTVELGLPHNLIDTAKKSLHSNNPYLDNILNLIFDDQKVTPEELNFLKEKTEENKFSKGFVNQRFWIKGIALYFPVFLSIPGFLKFLRLWHLGKSLNQEIFLDVLWLSTRLNIYSGKNLEEILSGAVEKTEKELLDVIKKKYSMKMNGKDIIRRLYDIDFPANLNAKEKESPSISLSQILRILEDEKIRIGSPDSNLLVENVKFRIQNNLWA